MKEEVIFPLNLEILDQNIVKPRQAYPNFTNVLKIPSFGWFIIKLKSQQLQTLPVHDLFIVFIYYKYTEKNTEANRKQL